MPLYTITCVLSGGTVGMVHLSHNGAKCLQIWLTFTQKHLLILAGPPWLSLQVHYRRAITKASLATAVTEFKSSPPNGRKACPQPQWGGGGELCFFHSKEP